MKCIDLFSGIGGFALALHPSVQTVLFCENNVLCQQVLHHQFPSIPIQQDVQTLASQLTWKDQEWYYGEARLGSIEMICGGFPCQDISVNKRNAQGLDGPKSGLFFSAMEVVRKVRPPYVFLENVPAIRTRGLQQVLNTFAEAGYVCRWRMVSAFEVGSPQNRRRWFCLATRQDAPPLSFPLSCESEPKREEPPIYNETRLTPLQRKMASAYGNAVCPAQCRLALHQLTTTPSSADRIWKTKEEMPSSGCMHADRTILETVFSTPTIENQDLLYPTPTFNPRPSEGTVRIARRLYVKKKIGFVHAAALCGRCPHLPKGVLLEHDPRSDFDVDPLHVQRCGECFGTHRNVAWVEWLMGYPFQWMECTK